MSLVTTSSPDAVDPTVQRLLAALGRRGIEVFACIDHAAGARAAGLELADEQLVVFGDPRVGTLLMQADASVGYELPLRILVWDEGGQTLLAHRPAIELLEGYRLAERREVLERMDALVAELCDEAAAAA